MQVLTQHRRRFFLTKRVFPAFSELLAVKHHQPAVNPPEVQDVRSYDELMKRHL